MSYIKLKSLCESGKLRIISIISPARCGSTLLERILANHEKVVLQVNEPWSQYNRYKSDHEIYKHILSKIEPYLIDTDTITVVIKDMADMFVTGEMFEEWIRLVDKIILNIRQPQLALESLINQVIKAMPEPLHDIDAHEGGYLRIEEPLLQFMSTYEERHSEKAYLDAICKERNLESHQKTEFIAKTNKTRLTGWHGIEELHNCLIKNGKDFCIVDSSMLRMAPRALLSILCERMDLTYSDNLINFKQETNFDWGFDTKTIPFFYKRVLASSKIDYPTEMPLSLSLFPYFIQDHLSGKEGCLKTYKTILMDKHLILNQEIVDSIFETPIQEDKTLIDIDPIFVKLFIESLEDRPDLVLLKSPNANDPPS